MRDPGHSYVPRRRRPWLIFVPVAALVVIAGAWCAFWFFAASRADAEIARWRQQEAARGRVYACAQQAISGFPFRIEVRCDAPSVDFKRPQPVSLKSKHALAVVQVYQPTLMISELTGPMTVADAQGSRLADITWQTAETSVRGLSNGLPERVSFVVDKLAVTRFDAGAPQRAIAADHVELHARQAPRLPQDTPALDVALRFAGATAPVVPQLASPPLEGEFDVVLRGLEDASFRPLAQVLRELQATGGRVDIRQARIRQGDILAVGQGTLKLTPAGRLDGEVNLTIAGLDQLVVELGLDQAVARQTQNAANRYVPGLNLDRLLGPRGNAAIAAAGVAMLGRPAELEGRNAVTLPLRFADGAVFLGPLQAGQMQPLF